MTLSIKNLLCAGAIAAAVALPFAASAQQNADAIRAKCLADVRAAYPTNIQFEHQVEGKQLYINCMQKHGLTP